MDTEMPQDHPQRRINTREQPTLVASYSQVTPKNTNLFRSCSLCVDGAVALTTSEDRTIELFTLPLATTEAPQLSPTRRFKQSESILGTLWYPTATPSDPAAFCFLASIRECPVKLLDASDGRLRASYRIVDHRERQIAPHSMSFNSMASKLYCGFQDAIEIFDVNYPGEGERVHTTPSKKSLSGVKGIVSALAFCPDYSGLYAAGTFSSSLVLYDESSGADIVLSLGGINGPVTQVKFNPLQPHLLYATSRQTSAIQAWDLRGDTSSPLHALPRPGRPTNQRLAFDVDAHGTTLATGDTDGSISCFELDAPAPGRASVKFKAHNDAIAATVFHPLERTLVSVSGSRHFDNDNDNDNSIDGDGDGDGDSDAAAASSSESESGSPSSSEHRPSFLRRPRALPTSRDTSLKLWRFRPQDAVLCDP